MPAKKRKSSKKLSFSSLFSRFLRQKRSFPGCFDIRKKGQGRRSLPKETKKDWKELFFRPFSFFAAKESFWLFSLVRAFRCDFQPQEGGKAGVLCRKKRKSSKELFFRLFSFFAAKESFWLFSWFTRRHCRCRLRYSRKKGGKAGVLCRKKRKSSKELFFRLFSFFAAKESFWLFPWFTGRLCRCRLRYSREKAGKAGVSLPKETKTFERAFTFVPFRFLRQRKASGCFLGSRAGLCRCRLKTSQERGQGRRSLPKETKELQRAFLSSLFVFCGERELLAVSLVHGAALSVPARI